MRVQHHLDEYTNMQEQGKQELCLTEICTSCQDRIFIFDCDSLFWCLQNSITLPRKIRLMIPGLPSVTMSLTFSISDCPECKDPKIMDSSVVTTPC